jgi:hypothetical protein
VSETETFVTRDTLLIVSLMRALPSAAHRSFAHFESEFWTDEMYFEMRRKVEAREAAREAAAAVETVPALRVIK